MWGRDVPQKSTHPWILPGPGLTQIDVGVKDALRLVAVVVQGQIHPPAVAEDGAELEPVDGQVVDPAVVEAEATCRESVGG